MPTALELACPRCARSNDERALVCDLCGHLLRRERASAAPAAGTSLVQDEPIEDSPRDERRAGLEPWVFLGLGLVTAPLFAWTPLLSTMGWFLASLVHEMGHAGLAWLCGMPAVPAISLAGHAAAVHAEQSVLLALSIAAALGALLWSRLAGRARAVTLVLFACLYPALAFTGARDLLHLLAGHGAELAFAALCLWKTLDGGFTDSRLERGLYGTLGWFLLGKNVALCWSLMQSASARSAYRSSGSFGFTNDYIRVAEEQLGCSLPAVAAGMLVACALVPPAAWCWWRVSARIGR